jgi:hypothetical protein
MEPFVATLDLGHHLGNLIDVVLSEKHLAFSGRCEDEIAAQFFSSAAELCRLSRPS